MPNTKPDFSILNSTLESGAKPSDFLIVGKHLLKYHTIAHFVNEMGIAGISKSDILRVLATLIELQGDEFRGFKKYLELAAKKLEELEEKNQ